MSVATLVSARFVCNAQPLYQRLSVCWTPREIVAKASEYAGIERPFVFIGYSIKGKFTHTSGCSKGTWWHMVLLALVMPQLAAIWKMQEQFQTKLDEKFIELKHEIRAAEARSEVRFTEIGASLVAIRAEIREDIEMFIYTKEQALQRQFVMDVASIVNAQLCRSACGPKSVYITYKSAGRLWHE
ncbi:hypothetical protein BGX38DRAFT_1141730 [Terfezia claveryi]|nr:hypothetical protein BGX38DRAFT_1141730 [Terfezia claveryi]